MTAQAGDTFVYDAAGRHLSTSNGATTVGYTRDASRSIVARSDTATGATVRYSAGAVLTAANTVIERTVSLAGGVLVTERGAGDVWSYPNLHGDITAICDSAGVKQGATIAYDPYGNTASVADNSAGAFDYGWVGQHTKGTEHATSLAINIEMGARIYNPTLGRFLAPDPIEGGSANAYDYANADPVNMLDLSGRDPIAQIHRTCNRNFSSAGWACENTMLGRDRCAPGTYREVLSYGAGGCTRFVPLKHKRLCPSWLMTTLDVVGVHGIVLDVRTATKDQKGGGAALTLDGMNKYLVQVPLEQAVPRAAGAITGVGFAATIARGFCER